MSAGKSASEVVPPRLRRLGPLLLPLAYMTAIFMLSSIPGEIDPHETGVMRVFLWVPPDVQNLLHVPVFAGLAWLWCLALRPWGLSPDRLAWLAFALTLAYGVADEIHQSFVPGRLANGADLLLNVIGAALAVWAFRGRLVRKG